MHTRARRPRGALVGAMVGAALSAAVWLAERAAIAHGADAAGLGFGDNHLLFFLCFPWSLAVVAVGATLESVGLHAIPPRLLFLMMPVVAGAAWGWVAGRLRARWRQPRAGNPPPLRRA